MDIEKQLDIELKVWEEAISKASDSIYGILISHLYLEYLLDRYLKVKLPKDAGLLGGSGLSFNNKLMLVKSFGEIDDQLADSLLKLNEIRNDCAHIFRHQISKMAVEKYGRTLGKK